MAGTVTTGASRGSERRSTVADYGAVRCRRKFLRFFPRGFRDPDDVETERDYKWESHLRWRDSLGVEEIAARAVRIEQRSLCSMLFSFEQMALRDAVKSASGARAFAEGLFAFLYGGGELQPRFEAWSRPSPACRASRPVCSPGRSSLCAGSSRSHGSTCS